VNLVDVDALKIGGNEDGSASSTSTGQQLGTVIGGTLGAAVLVVVAVIILALWRKGYFTCIDKAKAKYGDKKEVVDDDIDDDINVETAAPPVLYSKITKSDSKDAFIY
jgi:hypothetical protein